MSLQTENTQALSRIKEKKFPYRYIAMKLQISKDKEKILKTIRKSTDYLQRNNFYTDSHNALSNNKGRKTENIHKNAKVCKPGILYPREFLKA